MVPKMSFASSWALRRAGRARAGPRSGGAAPLLAGGPEPEIGRGVGSTPADRGRSCRAQSLE